jgi:hypothetical protein
MGVSGGRDAAHHMQDMGPCSSCIGGLTEMETSRTPYAVCALLLVTLFVVAWDPPATCGQDPNDPFVIPVIPVDMYSGGAGSPQDPFLITSVEDLEQLSSKSTNWGAYFKLTQDLDLEHKALRPIGTVHKPFTGSFDGGRHRIKNLLVYDGDPAVGGAGLFGVVGGAAALTGVLLENPTIIGNSSDDVGAMVGRLDAGTMWQCAVIGGRVFGSAGGDSCAGGLVGGNVEGTILECYSTATIEGVSSCGALVASNGEGGVIEDCYAAGRLVMRPLGLLDEPYHGGGLVGFNRGCVSYCYADTPITILSPGVSIGYQGGLIGAMVTAVYPNASWVLSCFSNAAHGAAIGSGSVPLPGGAIAVSRTTLMQRATFRHWDFEFVWSIQADEMPRLRWENP